MNAPSPRRPSRPLCVAHRGFSAVAPENTLAALRRAVEAGAEACEFDLHASRDGVPVLMHDPTVDRTTDGTGPVRGFTAAELGRLDAGSWKAPRFAGEPVPALADALATVRAWRCTPVLELKEEGLGRAVVDAVRAAGLVEGCVAVSFHDAALAELGTLEPRLARGLLVGGALRVAAGRWARHAAERAAACGATILSAHHGLLSRQAVAALHRRGLAVWCWTVDGAGEMARLAAWGVDAITTNRPDRLVAWRRR